MTDYGIKISEPGHDVKTADDINLSLKPGLTLLKVFAQGTVSLAAGDAEVAHNLGYVPQFLVFVYDGTKSYLATSHVSYASARADSTKLYIKDDGDSARYYIFYEQA